MRLNGIILALTLAAFGATAFAEEQTYEPGDFLVKFKEGTMTSVQGMSTFTEDGGTMESLGNNWVHIKVTPGQISSFGSDSDALATLRGNPSVEYAQPNYYIDLIENYKQTDPAIIEAARQAEALLSWKPKVKPEIPAAVITPEWGPDPLLGKQWGMDLIHAPEAWTVHRGDKNVVVAVIDTGVDYTHEDLAANIWHNPNEIPGNGKDDDGNGYVDDVVGWDFADNDNKPFDVAAGPLGVILAGMNPGHGTHCAGTIGAVGNNSVGITGVAPNVQIMPVRFLNARGHGDTAKAVKAINYAVSAGAKVLSNSWGSAGEEDDKGALKEAIRNAEAKGALFIAAAGNGRGGRGYNNDTDKKPSYPASYDFKNIISVAAVDKHKELGSFSNYGVKTVHVAAPGVGIMSTTVGGKYSDAVFKFWKISIPWAGTSMATPYVAGAAALVWSAHPEYKAIDVKNKLLSTVEKIPALQDKVSSGGLINVAAAVK